MNIFKELKKIVYSACLYFTVTEFVILLISAAFIEFSPENGGTAGMFLSLNSSFMILLTCFIMSALNLIWRLDYSISIKILIHFFGTLVAYSLIFIIIPKAYTNMGQIFGRLFVLVAIYLVVAFAVLVIRSIMKNRRSEKIEYNSQFDSLSGKK